jgi:hypothetical protein
MDIPEISHRCALCGAAIRPGAESCPNCGQAEAAGVAPRYEPAPETQQFAAAHADEPVNQAPRYEPEPDEPLIYEPVPEEAPARLEQTTPEVAAPPQDVAAEQPAPPPAVKVLDGPPPVYKHRRRRRYRPPTLRERLAYRVEQLRGASKDATRKVAPTVEQLRETSNIVLDRASDDPSARFLLIGALLTAIAAFVFAVSFFWG